MNNSPETSAYSAVKERSVDTVPVPLFEEGWTGEVPVVEVTKPSVEKAARTVIETARRVFVADKDPHTTQMSLAFARSENAKRQRLMDDERDTPYSELGGGLRAYTRQEEFRVRFDTALTGYQDWHSDTRKAVEQYRLWDMSPADFDAMTVADRERAALYLFGFLDRLKFNSSEIASYEGRLLPGHHLTDQYGAGHDPSDVLAYGHILEDMAEDIEASGMADRIRAQVDVSHRSTGRGHYAHRNAVLAHLKRVKRQHGDIEITYERGKFRTKPLET